MKKKTKNKKPHKKTITEVNYNKIEYKKTVPLIVWTILILAFSVFHLTNIYRDGDLRISRLGMWESDEGAYAYNATAANRYGETLTPGGLNTVLYCPALTVYQRFFFYILGISLWSSRFIGLFFFVLGQSFLLYFWKKENSSHIGSFALGIVSLNYMFFTFSRSSLPLVFTGFYLSLTTLVLFSKKLKISKAFILAIIGAIASLTKPSFMVIPASVGTYLFIDFVLNIKTEWKNKLISLIYFSFSLIFVGTMFYLLWIKRYPIEWDINRKVIMDSSRVPANITEAIQNIFSFFITLFQNPWYSFPFLVTIATIPNFIISFVNKPNGRIEKIQLWGILISAVWFIAVGNNTYRPPRYYSGFCWGWSIVVAIWLYRIFNKKETSDSKEKFTLVLPIIAGIVSLLFSKTSYIIPKFFLFSGIILGIVTTVVYFNNNFNKNKHLHFYLFSVFIIFVHATIFGFSYSAWKQNTKESYYDALMDIHSKLPQNCTILGRMGGFVSLVHPCKAYWGHYALNGKNPPPDFVMINRGEKEIQSWIKANPKTYDYLKVGWDYSFTPLSYTIMNNYYSGQNTVILKLNSKTE